MLNLIGLFFVIIGLFSIYSLTLNNKPIIFFKLATDNISFRINKPGQYAISIVKGRFVTIQEGVEVLIRQNNNKPKLSVKELVFRNKTYNKWYVGVELYQFKIEESGIYFIQIENPRKIIVKEPRFFTKGHILDVIKYEDIELAVENYYPFYFRIIAVFVLITGLVMMIL